MLVLQNPFSFLVRDSDVECMTDGYDVRTAYGFQTSLSERSCMPMPVGLFRSRLARATPSQGTGPGALQLPPARFPGDPTRPIPALVHPGHDEMGYGSDAVLLNLVVLNAGFIYVRCGLDWDGERGGGEG